MHQLPARAIPTSGLGRKYKAQGLVVIGVHTPEFAFEKNIKNVKVAVSDLRSAIRLPSTTTMRSGARSTTCTGRRTYFIDAQGKIATTILAKANTRIGTRHPETAGRSRQADVAPTLSSESSGAEAASDAGSVLSPETYVGYERAENFVSPGGAVEDARHVYAAGDPRLNEWGLAGDWTIHNENAVLNVAGGRIVYKFHARDLHLVLGPGADGQTVRFRVTIDGAAPGASHGSDIDSDGLGTVTAQRLYQLIRQEGAIMDRTFEIEFLDPGVQAYAFTFG